MRNTNYGKAIEGLIEKSDNHIDILDFLYMYVDLYKTTGDLKFGIKADDILNHLIGSKEGDGDE